jgi:hypothetical protein
MHYEQATLEDIFLAYYRKQETGSVPEAKQSEQEGDHVAA